MTDHPEPDDVSRELSLLVELKKEPRNPDRFVALGRLYAERRFGREKGLKYFFKASDLVLSESGGWDEGRAGALLEETVRLFPDLPDAFLHLAEKRFNDRDLPGAIQALDLWNHSPAAASRPWTTLAINRRLLLLHSESDTAMERCIRIARDLGLSRTASRDLTALARVKARLGLRNESISLLREALTLWPENPHARLGLAVALGPGPEGTSLIRAAWKSFPTDTAQNEIVSFFQQHPEWKTRFTRAELRSLEEPFRRDTRKLPPERTHLIAVLDRDPFSRKVLTAILQDAGFSVWAADSPRTIPANADLLVMHETPDGAPCPALPPEVDMPVLRLIPAGRRVEAGAAELARPFAPETLAARVVQLLSIRRAAPAKPEPVTSALPVPSGDHAAFVPSRPETPAELEPFEEAVETLEAPGEEAPGAVEAAVGVARSRSMEAPDELGPPAEELEPPPAAVIRPAAEETAARAAETLPRAAPIHEVDRSVELLRANELVDRLRALLRERDDEVRRIEALAASEKAEVEDENRSLSDALTRTRSEMDATLAERAAESSRKENESLSLESRIQSLMVEKEHREDSYARETAMRDRAIGDLERHAADVIEAERDMAARLQQALQRYGIVKHDGTSPEPPEAARVRELEQEVVRLIRRGADLAEQGEVFRAKAEHLLAEQGRMTLQLGEQESQVAELSSARNQLEEQARALERDRDDSRSMLVRLTDSERQRRLRLEEELAVAEDDAVQARTESSRLTAELAASRRQSASLEKQLAATSEALLRTRREAAFALEAGRASKESMTAAGRAAAEWFAEREARFWREIQRLTAEQHRLTPVLSSLEERLRSSHGSQAAMESSLREVREDTERARWTAQIERRREAALVESERASALAGRRGAAELSKILEEQRHRISHLSRALAERTVEFRETLQTLAGPQTALPGGGLPNGNP